MTQPMLASVLVLTCFALCMPFSAAAQEATSIGGEEESKKPLRAPDKTPVLRLNRRDALQHDYRDAHQNRADEQLVERAPGPCLMAEDDVVRFMARGGGALGRSEVDGFRQCDDSAAGSEDREVV